MANSVTGMLHCISKTSRSSICKIVLLTADSYNSLDGGPAAQALGFPELRQQLLSRASGHVLVQINPHQDPTLP